jgi:hypothetical protein
MSQPQITERQQYWRDHVLAAAAYGGSIVEYAAANNLKTKDLYQWKTALTKRGFLTLENEKPVSDFAKVAPTATPAQNSMPAASSVQCRLTLPCGSVLEYFNPVKPDTIARLLSGLRTKHASTPE